MRFRRRLILAGLGSSLIPAFAAAPSRAFDIGDAIDRSGRQRMLSQRMVKAWIALGMGVETQRARKVLDESSALFERQLADLQSAYSGGELKPVWSALDPLWKQLKTALDAKPAKPELAALIALDGKVLALANQATGMLEKQSGQNAGRLVNMAGRQRMLSQRMAKFQLARAWNAGIADAPAQIETARTEFVAALRELDAAPEATPAIHDEMQLAGSQWLFFDIALKAADGGRPGDVFVASENLITVFDKVTGLYARRLG